MLTDEDMRGRIGPRVTKDHIDKQIVQTQYYQFPDTMLIVCCFTLRNGFNVTGESACVSPDNFLESLGQKIAFEKIWHLKVTYLNKNFLVYK